MAGPTPRRSIRPISTLAARYHVPLVPFILLNVIGNPRLMQPDRAHPNADGARAIADVIWPYLERVLSSVASARRSAEPSRSALSHGDRLIRSRAC